MAARTPALRVEGLRYEIDDRVLLDDLDFQVSAGQSLAVTGPSGSGKSTLLMCALGLVKPDSGTVSVAGTDVTRLSARGLASHRRRHLGVVFQFGELLPELSPLENVAIAALLGGVERRRAYADAADLLRWLGVPERGTTGLLSGGERQRTAVARALVMEPTVVLADEPTGALDQRTRETVAELLFDVPARRGCALVVVTHDPSVAARADARVSLDSGRLVERS
ncbi:ABC transporter ATP-binding protein [Actinomadura litoris]|uniref:ABC transporter ATP-binding protein n=1 Tax=Actinomadura litoris TaxID=2678616 RepID=UPI0027E1E03B|nr:ABC transporter ATP-binding protein [Actinomadura litoris]